MKGIILAGETGTKLYPVTKGVSKQLLPVYDKPMIYYPLSVLMLAGIREFLIITTPQDKEQFKRVLGNGSKLGIDIKYATQASPKGIAEAFLIGEKFIGNDECAMILGDNIFYGNGFISSLGNALTNAKEGKATNFVIEIKDASKYGVVELDENNKIIDIEEKPLKPKSNFAVTGLYFYPKGVAKKVRKLKPSKRGFLEITALNKMYLEEKNIEAELLGGGFTWFDMTTFNSILEATTMIKSIQNNQGKVIASLEQIAYYQNWLTEEQLIKQGEAMQDNDYGKYLLEVASKKERR